MNGEPAKAHDELAAYMTENQNPQLIFAIYGKNIFSTNNLDKVVHVHAQQFPTNHFKIRLLEISNNL